MFNISVLENINVLNYKKRAYFGLVCLVCLSYECILSIWSLWSRSEKLLSNLVRHLNVSAIAGTTVNNASI